MFNLKENYLRVKKVKYILNLVGFRNDKSNYTLTKRNSKLGVSFESKFYVKFNKSFIKITSNLNNETKMFLLKNDVSKIITEISDYIEKLLNNKLLELLYSKYGAVGTIAREVLDLYNFTEDEENTFVFYQDSDFSINELKALISEDSILLLKNEIPVDEISFHQTEDIAKFEFCKKKMEDFIAGKTSRIFPFIFAATRSGFSVSQLVANNNINIIFKRKDKQYTLEGDRIYKINGLLKSEIEYNKTSIDWLNIFKEND